MISSLSANHRVSLLCELFSVSRSSYYAYISGESYSLSLDEQLQSERVFSIFWDHKRRYGSRRIQAELLDEGIFMGRRRISSIMKELGIKAIQPKSFVPKTTESCAAKLRSPNLLLEADNAPRGINQVAVGDITYLPKSGGGWLYLCTWMDLFSRNLAGWKVDDHMEATIATDSLKMFIRRRDPPQGMIVHSDGGRQFVAQKFRKLLSQNGLKQSMTRVDNHYDNAFAESLFSRLKAELFDEFNTFKDVEDAKNKIFEYIEGYYNIKRKHSALGYKSPKQFEDLLSL